MDLPSRDELDKMDEATLSEWRSRISSKVHSIASNKADINLRIDSINKEIKRLEGELQNLRDEADTLENTEKYQLFWEEITLNRGWRPDFWRHIEERNRREAEKKAVALNGAGMSKKLR